MFRRLMDLESGERKLLAAGLFWVIAARAVMRAPGTSFCNQQRALDALSAALPHLRACTSGSAAWAVTAVARRVPGTRCLAWALAMRGLLAQAGISAVLRIGVVTPEPGVLRAHAWVECEGRSLTWGDDVEGYNVLRGPAEA